MIYLIDLSGKKTDFNDMKESYYKVYANLVLIEKLSDKLEFSSISKEFSTIYKNVIHIKEVVPHV